MPIDWQDNPGAFVVRACIGQGYSSVVLGEIPDEHHLCNFVVIGDGTWPPEDGKPSDWHKSHPVDLLVLDPYGNDQWPTALKTRVFGEGIWTLGIDRRTGEMYRVAFEMVVCPIERPDGVGFAVGTKLIQLFANLLGEGGNEHADAPVVPVEYLSRLGELMNKKRPFRVSVDAFAALDVLDGEEGYAHLRDRLVVYLDFDDAGLEISGDNHRTVSSWELSTTWAAEQLDAGRKGRAQAAVGLLREDVRSGTAVDEEPTVSGDLHEQPMIPEAIANPRYVPRREL